MRDAEEARLVLNPEPVTPLGPSVYTKLTGHGPEARPAVGPAPAPAGPCVYTPAQNNYPTLTSREPRPERIEGSRP
jgi:hypothetical protein